MRYAAILGNDCLNATDGFAVSLWTQGCPFHCKGCHNKHTTWDFKGGIEDDVEHVISVIKEKLVANGVQRDFSVLGGEPLCDENFEDVLHIIASIREEFPTIKIHVWTGYTLEDLYKRFVGKRESEELERFLGMIDILVDGPYKEELRDVDLPYRGSSNQRVLKRGYDF